MKKRKQVALLMSPGWFGTEAELRGILDYARSHGNWTLVTVPENFSGSLRDLRRWKGDGAIASVKTRQEAEIVSRLRIPVVGVSGVLEEGSLPRVLTDNRKIGRMGAAHLLDCGFRRLAFVGRRGADDVANRRHGFRERAATLKASVSTFMTPSFTATWKAWNTATARLEEFVNGLTPPVGIMACDDVRARMVLEACHAAGLRVPDDVAIIGVDNNEPVCEFCDPPLSSIERPDHEMGYEAAALLDRMMAGRKVAPVRDVLLQPKGIVKRRSTDVLAIENAHVRAAVEYIRDHANEVFGVERLTEVVPISRRWLETNFQNVMGCTLHQHICRVRVEKAKELLVLHPKQKLQDIAAACGFASPKRFRIVFQRLTGLTPAAYRKS
ncbi:MAG: DNA-binding transcriptional regulator [Kiritimatiellia bacterium]|jgi:LacI family transcriptional regulator|nr:DNA-binding transcriptional regulator [Kiritimatiellia bacterium]